MAPRWFPLRSLRFHRQSPSDESARRSSLEEREHQFAFRDNGVVHHAMTFLFRQAIAARFRQLRVNEDRIARENRFAKLHPVRAHEVTDATRSLRQFEQ